MLDEAKRAAIPDRARFHEFVRSLFLHRRKLLRGALIANYKSRLSKGEIDAMLIATAVDDPGLLSLPLYDEPFQVALPAQHPWRQRKGVKVGFITTRGFEDTTLIMRAVGRVDGLSEDEIRRVTSITKPDPLVAPELIRGVPERIDVEGNVVIPIDREAARVAMTRFVKRGGKVWVRVFPDKPITKKPQETRMGKGKGAPEEWVCVVRPGRVLFEMEGVSETDAREAMRLAAAKLPILTKFATRFAQEKA